MRWVFVGWGSVCTVQEEGKQGYRPGVRARFAKTYGRLDGDRRDRNDGAGRAGRGTGTEGSAGGNTGPRISGKTIMILESHPPVPD